MVRKKSIAAHGSCSLSWRNGSDNDYCLLKWHKALRFCSFSLSAQPSEMTFENLVAFLLSSIRVLWFLHRREMLSSLSSYANRSDLKGSKNWKESPTSCRFSNEEVRPVLTDVDALGTTVPFPQWLWTHRFRRQKTLGNKAFYWNSEALVYFPRVFYKEEHFLRIVSLLFHIRNMGPSTLPFVDCPRVARHTRAREMEGDRRVSRLQVWLWRQRDKFQVCSLLLPIVFFFLILYHYFSFPIKLERLMEKWAYLVNDATSTVVE